LSVKIARMITIFTLVLFSVGFIVSSVYATTTGDTRPGWGHGDDNHDHTGPPGQSVNPTKEPNPSKTPKPTKTP
jgi:hypothetical protein